VRTYTIGEIAERSGVTALLTDLRGAATHLDREPLDGPCEADCACLAMATIPQPVALQAGRTS
jgi:hypothetical protein